MRRLVSEYCSALLTRLFHTHILAFGGLFTVPYCALKLGRRAVSAELSDRYFRDGVAYVQAEARKAAVPTLFDLIKAEPAREAS